MAIKTHFELQLIPYQELLSRCKRRIETRETILGQIRKKIGNIIGNIIGVLPFMLFSITRLDYNINRR